MRLGADGATKRKLAPADKGGGGQRNKDQQINPDHSGSEAGQARIERKPGIRVRRGATTACEWSAH
jgi:hypothetical protein